MNFKLVCVQQEEIAHYKIVMESMNINSKAALATFGSLIALTLFGDFCFHYPKISFSIVCVAAVSVLVWVLYVAFIESFKLSETRSAARNVARSQMAAAFNKEESE